MGMLQISLDSELCDDQRECLQSAASSAAHLLDVVDNILEFSETDTGRVEIVRAPFDLRKCVREVVNRMSPQVFRKNLQLAYFISVDVPEMPVGDARRVAQVLTHLLSNAVKFTNQGSIGIESICVEDDGGRRTGVKFVVSDTGIGVAAESLDAIFEVFTQGDGSLTRSYGGLGLGLSISSRLVALMGGRMSVQSEPGKGSRFEFTVPLVGSGLGPRPSSQGGLPGRAVLIVEPDPATRSFAERALLEERLEVTCCSDAEQMLSVLTDDLRRFGAILLANELTGSSGFDLAERLCKEFGLCDRVLMTLDRADESAQTVRCHELGVGGYFVRPVNYDEVREWLRSRMTGAPTPIGPKNAMSPNVTAPIHSLRVLLVEDNPINQTVLKRMLQKQGHSVLTADQGLAALSTLEEVNWEIDLILMDMQMPELDGYETTARIRVLEQTRGGHLPIIAATAHAMAGDAERCLGAGMDGYITKPIQIAVLSKAIAKVMSNPFPSSQLNRKVS
jgi:two-component system sensor histidine kinase/response regulator